MMNYIQAPLQNYIIQNNCTSALLGNSGQFLQIPSIQIV